AVNLVLTITGELVVFTGIGIGEGVAEGSASQGVKITGIEHAVYVRTLPDVGPAPANARIAKQMVECDHTTRAVSWSPNGSTVGNKTRIRADLSLILPATP